MTVKELMEILATYPDDMNVKVSCDRFIRDVERVDIIVDIDTNIVSVNISAKDRHEVNIYDKT